MNNKLDASERMNKRYLLIEGSKEEVERAILDYTGVLGWAKASPTFVESSHGKVILAIDRKELDNIRAAFEVFDGNLKVLRVSGTLKGLKK